MYRLFLEISRFPCGFSFKIITTNVHFNLQQSIFVALFCGVINPCSSMLYGVNMHWRPSI